MNYAALLAVLAGVAFGLPLLVQGGEALGLPRIFGVLASLVLSGAVAVWWAVRQRAAVTIHDLDRRPRSSHAVTSRRVTARTDPPAARVPEAAAPGEAHAGPAGRPSPARRTGLIARLGGLAAAAVAPEAQEDTNASV